MDGRGGCCIARYTGNMYDMSKIDRIMLKYRPIAPKPATNSSGSGSSTAENNTAYVKIGRGKRRYVRNNSNKKMDNTGNGSVTKRCKCRKKRKSSSSDENESNGRSTVSTGSVSGGDGIVTLPLLPETPEKKEEDGAQESPARGACRPHTPLWLDFGSGRGSHPQQDGRAAVAAQKPVRVVETWVRVEYITEMDVYDGGGGLGRSDEEKLMNMERDTCPGFITDGSSRVIWVNRAYKEMICREEKEEVVVFVKLIMKEGVQLPPANWPAFTCRVRVVTCGKVKSSSVVTLPCDVWRLGGGGGGQGFAWRMDTKAALSLGR